MATHSSVLAWRIPGTGEPGGLPSMGSLRVGPDCSDLAAAAAAKLNCGAGSDKMNCKKQGSKQSPLLFATIRASRTVVLTNSRQVS